MLLPRRKCLGALALSKYEAYRPVISHLKVTHGTHSNCRGNIVLLLCTPCKGSIVVRVPIVAYSVLGKILYHTCTM